MTEAETNKILGMIHEQYPMFRKDRDPAVTSRLWHAIFENKPYQAVEWALIRYIATDAKGYPPVPGALNQILDSALQQREMPEGEAWNILFRAISRSGYHAGEAFASLPPAIQHVVRSPDQLHSWALMEESYVQNNIRPFFCRAYKDGLERERREKLLPSGAPPLLY